MKRLVSLVLSLVLVTTAFGFEWQPKDDFEAKCYESFLELMEDDNCKIQIEMYNGRAPIEELEDVEEAE